VELPEKKTAILSSSGIIPRIAQVELLLLYADIPKEDHERLQSTYMYDVIVEVKLIRNQSYDLSKSYSIKITSLLRNKENNERSSEKCKRVEVMEQDASCIKFSYKTGYECEVRKLTRNELVIEFEITIMPKDLTISY